MSIARPDRAFFFIAAACALAYISLPRDTAYYDRWFQLFPVAAVVATLAGVWLHRPRSKAPWYLVAISGLCAVTADALYAIELEQIGEVPFPSTSDYFALGSYVVLAAALLLMIRKQAPGRDWPSLIDAGIVTVGVGLVGWTFLVHPALTNDSSALATSVALAFPVMDILLVSLAARMVLGPGLRSPAFAMVTVALVFQLAGDALYGFGSLHGWYQVGDSVDLFFVLAAVLWGTAALHPSMVELTEPNPDPEQRLSGKRLAVLSAATLAAPAMLAVAAVKTGASELLVIVGAGAALGALVIVRLAGLVARHERSERREHVLSSAAAAFVSAWTRDDIHLVAVKAAHDLVGQEDSVVELSVDGSVVSAAGRVGTGGGVRTEVPLSVTGEDVALVFHTGERLAKQARDGVEAIAAQAALALEGANLAADLHERQSAERFRALVQNSSDVIALLSPDLVVRYHTPSVERVLGYGEDELVGRKLTELLEHDEGERIAGFFADVCATPGAPMPRDLPLRRKDGTVVQLESVFNNLLSVPTVGGVVLTARDVTERRALEDQLAHQAFHDSLTGLANRALFAERISHAIERGTRRPNLFAVLFIDLDDFKTVNDSLGHAAGDELLVAVAARIRSALRPEDTCARLGGDEFAVMIESISDADGAVTVARRILGTMAHPLVVAGSEVTVQGSIGIALDSGGQTANEIMRSADLAMYQAKSEGKGRFALYEPAMHEHVLRRLELKADLQRAVVEHEFVVHYQPIVTLQTGGVVGVEALVRWQHPQRGLVFPGEFLGLAEETGLILPLGRHVLKAACAEVASWRRRGYPRLGVSVNLSAKQLVSRGLPAEIATTLESCALESSALTLEITESTLLDSQAVVARLAELRGLGVRIAIDDFGTGYSSLNYLRRFPVDTLKIAKPFVDELGTSPEQDRLVAAILRLGSTMGLETVAEGIELEQQRDRLRQLRCRYGQGYFYSHPVPADELDAVLVHAEVA
ncbi:MAG TPA: EAL domain-containing protein [Gaiellaceae bacterium]|nr:EAL domain-containing protein [Gaiellaceae bacterium]